MLNQAMRMCLAVCVGKGSAYSEIISISGISSTESSVLAHESASEVSSLWERESSVAEGDCVLATERVFVVGVGTHAVSRSIRGKGFARLRSDPVEECKTPDVGVWNLTVLRTSTSIGAYVGLIGVSVIVEECSGSSRRRLSVLCSRRTPLPAVSGVGTG
jgi:hypothetical protein